jgi:hypothetical protein
MAIGNVKATKSTSLALSCKGYYPAGYADSASLVVFH